MGSPSSRAGKLLERYIAAHKAYNGKPPRVSYGRGWYYINDRPYRHVQVEEFAGELERRVAAGETVDTFLEGLQK